MSSEDLILCPICGKEPEFKCDGNGWCYFTCCGLESSCDYTHIEAEQEWNHLVEQIMIFAKNTSEKTEM